MDARELTRHRRIGVAAMVVGGTVSIVAALATHFVGLPKFNNLGVEIYPAIPRAWQLEVLGQIVSLGGVLLFMAGVAIGFLYGRKMTWALASIGAALFTALTIILFGIVPNEWLTLAQATWQWTPQRIAFTLPRWLTLNNEVAISYSAIKDAVSGGYTVVVTGAIAVAMIKWQTREARAPKAAPPEPVSPYGRPLRKVGR